jgi:ATP-dependent Lon protease
MRQISFKPHILKQVSFDGMSQRDQTAVQKVASGLLKIVFPHRSPETLQSDELGWALDLGVELRQRVIDQLAIIAPGEFKQEKLSYQWKAVA